MNSKAQLHYELNDGTEVGPIDLIAVDNVTATVRTPAGVVVHIPTGKLRSHA